MASSGQRTLFSFVAPAPADLGDNLPTEAKRARRAHQEPNHVVPPACPVQELKGKTLRFRPQWYVDFPWLHHAEGIEGVLCFYCQKAKDSNLAGLATKAEVAFSSEGYKNWKNAKERFQKHQQSDTHHFCVSQLTKQKQPVDIHLVNQSARAKQTATKCLVTIFTSVRYIFTNGLASRGSTADTGNFLDLLKLRSDDVPELKEWLARKVNYTSWSVQNEIASLFANAAVRQVVENITGPFGIVVDGTQDISGVEQETIVIRWSDDQFVPHEDFVGMYAPPDTSGATLAKIVKDVLLRLGLPLDKLRGQTYDGAANMSGVRNGAQALIRQTQPLALFVQCGAHSAALAMSHALEESRFVTDCIQWVHELGVLFRRSSKMRSIFAVVAADEDSYSKILRPLCPTRWLVRGPALQKALTLYKSVLTSLDELAASSDGDMRKQAIGLRTRFEAPQTILGLKIALAVFHPLEALNRALQSASQTVAGMATAVEATVIELQSERNAAAFSRLFEFASNMAANAGLEEIMLPRQKAPPRRFSGPAPATVHETAESYYRADYFRIVDFAVSQLKQRFDQEGISVYRQLEDILLRGGGPEPTIPYPEINSDTVCTDIQRFKTAFGDFGTLPEAIEKLIGQPAEVRALYPGLEALLRLLQVVPASSSTAERTFSKLRCLKTWLRSTVTQKRLNHMAVCYVHRDLVNGLDIPGLINEFIDSQNGRSDVFSRF